MPRTRDLVLQKTATGINGLDQILGGGLPAGRNALVCGAAGSGKTMFAMEYLIRGAMEFDEPGVAVIFEETPEEIATNLSSLGHNVPALIAQRKLDIDFVQIDRKQIEETGEYDLEALFIRLDHAIRKVKAKRVVIDTLEVLFSGLENEAIVRAELRRLFRHLKEQGVTSIITAERGDNRLTRYGLEEYVADCVILLDHRVNEQVSTRRLRVVKYRGSEHGTNEYPFLVDAKGIAVVPITSLGLTHKASKERVSTGVPMLDDMLGGKGYFQGASVLLSGTAGTGKSTFAASFANSACRRAERALYLAMEESPSQILRNMESVGMNLNRWIKTGKLRIISERPTTVGLEAHLAKMIQSIDEFKPDVVVLDPITNLISVGDVRSVKGMLTRLVDYLKMHTITAVFTNLTFPGMVEETTTGISSLMDTWIVLLNEALDGDRRRTVSVLKSRGMAHSSRTEEFTLNDTGIAPGDHYGPMATIDREATA